LRTYTGRKAFPKAIDFLKMLGLKVSTLVDS
jgi:hypothetical protein